MPTETSSDGWETIPQQSDGWEPVAQASSDGWESIPRKSDEWEALPPAAKPFIPSTGSVPFNRPDLTPPEKPMGFGDIATHLASGVARGANTLVAGVVDANAAISELANQVPAWVPVPLARRSEAAIAGDRKAADFFRQNAAEFSGPEARTTGEKVLQGVGGAVPYVVGAAVAPEAVLPAIGVSVGGETYRQAREQGIAPVPAAITGAGVGLFDAMAGHIVNKIPGVGPWLQQRGASMLANIARNYGTNAGSFELMNAANALTRHVIESGYTVESAAKAGEDFVDEFGPSMLIAAGLSAGHIPAELARMKQTLKQGGGPQEPAATAGGVDRPGQERPTTAGTITGPDVGPATEMPVRAAAEAKPLPLSEAANVAPPPEAAPRPTLEDLRSLAELPGSRIVEEKPNAEGIRSNQGQPVEEGRQSGAGEADRRGDLQQPTQGQSAAQGQQDQAAPPLTQEQTKRVDDAWRSSDSHAQVVRLEDEAARFRNAGDERTARAIEETAQEIADNFHAAATERVAGAKFKPREKQIRAQRTTKSVNDALAEWRESIHNNGIDTTMAAEDMGIGNRPGIRRKGGKPWDDALEEAYQLGLISEAERTEPSVIGRLLSGRNLSVEQTEAIERRRQRIEAEGELVRVGKQGYALTKEDTKGFPKVFEQFRGYGRLPAKPVEHDGGSAYFKDKAWFYKRSGDKRWRKLDWDSDGHLIDELQDRYPGLNPRIDVDFFDQFVEAQPAAASESLFRDTLPVPETGTQRAAEVQPLEAGEFSLAPPQTIAERQAEMTQAATKQTIEAKQSERIAGTAGDLGTGDMFDRTAGDSALFTHQNALESAAGKAVRELGEVPASESKAAAQSREAREQAGKMGLIGGSPVQMLAEIENFVRGLAREIRSTPKFTAFRETLNAWVGKNQQNVLEIRALAKELERVVPSARRREAITNWLQAGGDVNVLQQRASATRDPRLKRAYVEAMALKPEEIAAADSIRRLYDNMLATAQQYGLVDVGIENYVNQVWKRPFVGGGSGAEFAGKLKSSFKFGKHRSFESFFDGEQAGFQPVTKDISKLAAMYLNEMNKVIATRDMIRDLTTKTASDGRPLAAPTGSASVTDSTGPGDPQTVFVRPGTKAEDFRDYKTIPNPALAKWKWAAQSDDGTTVLVQGNLALHPEVYGHLKDVLSRSAIREWYDKPSGAMMTALKGIVKAADFGGSVVKQTMLDISPFHYVQEGTHAIGHKVNPFYNLPELNPADPRQVDAMRHGLMLAGDHVGAEQFMDGIAGGPQSLIRRVPWIGDIAHTASDYLFTQYIPRLKLKTYNHILARNEARYAGKLAAGEVTADDVKYLSAQQTNAAYGHLNYADMGRNPTWQHIWRSWLLAPDFLEARARFTGQSLKPGTSGAEQRAAMLTLALVMYGASRVGNILLNEDRDPHFEEPFGIKHNGRLYTMRSVPEDIWRMFKDTRRFVYGRLSPLLGRGTIQALSGVNYRGERVDFSDTASDLATSVIPMSLRALPGAREWSESTRNNPVTAWEQFISSVGLQISRNSPISETHKLAGDWMKQQGMKEDRGNYPVSKYQQLRYALEDNDPVRAKRAMEELTKTEQPWKITQGFRQSLFHPFTQSAGMDFTFRASLDPKDRAVYDHAVETRRAIWKRYTETVAPKP